MKNLYSVLGVSPGSPEPAIKAAYRELTRTRHPDAGGDSAAFAEITHAGSVLCDRDQRYAYDRQLHALFDPCSECGGQGITYIYKSFTEAIPRRCATCQGDGYHARR